MKTNRNGQQVAVLARLPVLGRVKRRLAAVVGDEIAFNCYQELFNIAIEAARPFAATLWLDSHSTTFSTNTRLQPFGTLGERMFNAFEAGAQVLIGSDIPSMTSSYISTAFQQLQDHDVVIGPTEDGGYCLIGMNKPCRSLFVDIEWGEPTVLQETLTRGQEVNLSVALLPMLWDVDDIDAYKRWCGVQASSKVIDYTL